LPRCVYHLLDVRGRDGCADQGRSRGCRPRLCQRQSHRRTRGRVDRYLAGARNPASVGRPRLSGPAWVAFLAAGAIGAAVRHVVHVWVTDRTGGPFPLGTLLINASGSLLLGFLTGLALYHGFPSTPRVVL